jgi:hypothetical protein
MQFHTNYPLFRWNPTYYVVPFYDHIIPSYEIHPQNTFYFSQKKHYQVNLSSPIHQLKRCVSCPQHGWMGESQSQNAHPWVPWELILQHELHPIGTFMNYEWMGGPCVQLAWNLLIYKFSFQENEGVSFSLGKVNG